jgi:glycosyltransferase involved in cell wall biosynthesis
MSEFIERPFAIEGSFFQLSKVSGIARLWVNVFAEWARDGFLDQVVLLDRGGSAPVIPGLRRVVIPPHDYENLDADPGIVQEACDAVDAAAYCSTYYSRPLTTPTVALIYDMIPEVLNSPLESPMWLEKHRLIRHAERFVCISESTRRDLLRWFPKLECLEAKVAYPGVAPEFFAPIPEDRQAVVDRFGIDRDYIVFIGMPESYKGGDTLVRAVASLPEDERPAVVFVTNWTMSQAYVDVLGADGVYAIPATDAEMRMLLKHATAYVNASYYEGFGLTVVEAMACGCPVISSTGGSLPEAGGDAVLSFPPGDAAELAKRIVEIRDFAVANRLVVRGNKQARKFSWAELAAAIRVELVAAAKR